MSIAERAAATPELELTFMGRPVLDLEDDESIRRTVAETAPDIIVSAAAYTAVDQAEDEFERAQQINARAPGVLAESARAAGARLIHLSTDYVFDGRKAEPYCEDDPVAPINAYGRTKLAGEEAIRAAFGDHVIVRTAWVYSPFGRNFVKTMLALAESREELAVVDDQIGSPTCALDIAEGILTIVRGWRHNSNQGLGETFHLAGQGTASWADLARHIFAVSEAAGGPKARVEGISTEQWPTPAVRPRNSRLDSSRFREAFGYSAPHWQKSVDLIVGRLLSHPPAASADR